MEIAGLSIAILNQASNILKSCKDRLGMLRNGQRRYDSLTASLDRLRHRLVEVEDLMRVNSASLPVAIVSSLEAKLAAVQDNFNDENLDFLQCLEKAFVGSGSAVDTLKSKGRQVLRAKKLLGLLEKLEDMINRSSTQLESVFTVLAKPRLEDEMQDPTVKEVYTPVTTTPAPSQAMILHFNSKDNEGKPNTPEGLLKQSVLYGESSQPITAVTGSIKPAYGVVGTAGVGKTVALRGLGHDEDVKNRFYDGVHYFTFGKDATLQTAISEIAAITALTGSCTQVEKVRCATTFREAVNHAVIWFEGRVCLYILDDLWPARKLPDGYFDDLRQLLRGSPHSRMVISTRMYDIAYEAGCIVEFSPRRALGQVSVAMFMSHANRHSTLVLPRDIICDLRPSVSKILSICGGLPIALSVTGCAVSRLTRIYGSFEKACDEYAVKLEKKRSFLGDKCTGYGKSLNSAIALSLECLEDELSGIVTRPSTQIHCTGDDLYTSLCVLSHQAWMPLSALSKLWKLEEDVTFSVAKLFEGMSLAVLKVHRVSSELPEQVVIELHDLLLDFCQEKAQETVVILNFDQNN